VVVSSRAALRYPTSGAVSISDGGGVDIEQLWALHDVSHPLALMVEADDDDRDSEKIAMKRFPPGERRAG
jgi:hypothetical protein